MDQLNAPTVDPEIIHIIIAMNAAAKKYDFIQSDIVGACMSVFHTHRSSCACHKAWRRTGRSHTAAAHQPLGALFATTVPANDREAMDACPPALNQATHSPDGKEWKLAIEAELDHFRLREAFTPVLKRIVVNHLLLSTTWIFTVKDTTDPDTGESLLKFIARLTARGDLDP